MKTFQTLLLGVGVWFLSNWSWGALMGDGNGGAEADSTGGAGGAGADGTGGAGGSGSGGAGGAGGSSDYAALADAINALAAGVQLPNIQTKTVVLAAAGTAELAPAVGGKRNCVLAYAVTGSGAINTEWQDNGATIWRVDTEAVAGKAGANLATAWPGFLFATAGGSALNVTTSAAAVVSVTYWTE